MLCLNIYLCASSQTYCHACSCPRHGTIPRYRMVVSPPTTHDLQGRWNGMVTKGTGRMHFLQYSVSLFPRAQSRPCRAHKSQA